MAARFCRALESVSIASALSSTLTIYPCQIRVHQRWQSKLQLLTARKKELWPATADSLPQAVTCQHCDTHCVSGDRAHNLPIVSPTRYQLCYRDHHHFNVILIGRWSKSYLIGISTDLNFKSRKSVSVSHDSWFFLSSYKILQKFCYGQKSYFKIRRPSSILNLKVWSFGRRTFVIGLICFLQSNLTQFHQNLMICRWNMAI